MDKNLQPQSPLQRQNNFAKEKDILLMKYHGIFKKNIKEYAEKVIPILRKKTNYSK